MQTARIIEGWRKTCQDRAEAFERGSAAVLVVADGAGGTGGGGEAAELVVDRVRRVVEAGQRLVDPKHWCEVLREIDAALEANPMVGESTAVVAVCTRVVVVGASVGDSGCWLLTEEASRDLTRHQKRRPLLGSGWAQPTAFWAPFVEGVVLAGSDGLLKYAPMEKIRPVAMGGDLAAAAKGLVDLVRLPTGALQDDVGIALCRQAAE